MKHDTSLVRVIFIVLFCLLAFPFAYLTLSNYWYSHQGPNKIEGLEIFAEFNSVKNHLSRYVAENEQWPITLKEANYLSREYNFEFNLSEPWSLIGQIHDKTLNENLRGRVIKFDLNPSTKQWVCDVSATNLPNQLKPDQCDGKLSKFFNSFSIQTWSILIATAAVIIIILLALYRHPLLKLLRKNNFSLSKQKFTDLQQLHFLALLTGHQNAILKANDLTQPIWKNLSRMSRLNANENIKSLLQSLPIKSVITEKKSLYRVTLSDQFELNLNEILVAVINDNNPNKVIKNINQLADTSTPILIWATNLQANAQLRLQKSHINQLCLIPNQQQMTQMSMLKTGRNCLIELASKHLPISSISPYQGKGGVIKSSHFFGRHTMLEKLASQTKTNFLLVGGRQMGKTSLLKALYRKLNAQPNNLCYYISLSDARLLPRLAYHGEIQQYTDFNDLITQIKQNNPNKKLRLLIDEADLFIQAEVENNFKLLNEIRPTVESGFCQFIFAGFWDLYAHAVLDYHSPLRNLAQSLTVGALESAAAKQLIRQPMSMLGQHFATDAVIEDIYKKTGGRANLINLVCEYLVDQLTQNKQKITPILVAQAYQSDHVSDALQGWSSLTREPHACGLDRIIVYLTFIHENISLNIINQEVQSHQLTFNSEQMKQSLQRLRLAHIIEKRNNNYQFAVPLFAQQHDKNEAQILLNQEIKYLKS